MKKLIKGLVEFRRSAQSGYRKKFSQLAQGQSPDVLFVACSDSRVVPNTFASTDPGDLFVVRNVGNLIPPCCEPSSDKNASSEMSAIEFSILNLNVTDVIICGHSECGAMEALIGNVKDDKTQHLKAWLLNAKEALNRLNSGQSLDSSLSRSNQLSQINVLLQMEHVKTYPVVKERMLSGQLRVHGWWFDITKADVYAFEEDQNKFIVIDEVEADRLLARLST